MILIFSKIQQFINRRVESDLDVSKPINRQVGGVVEKLVEDAIVKHKLWYEGRTIDAQTIYEVIRKRLNNQRQSKRVRVPGMFCAVGVLQLY